MGGHLATLQGPSIPVLNATDRKRNDTLFVMVLENKRGFQFETPTHTEVVFVGVSHDDLFV